MAIRTLVVMPNWVGDCAMALPVLRLSVAALAAVRPVVLHPRLVPPVPPLSAS